MKAAGRRSSPSRSGNRERTTGVVVASTAVEAAPRRNTTDSWGWASEALTASPPEMPIAPTVTPISSRRLSKLSARVPPMRENASRGPSWASPRSPTSNDERVWWYTWNGRAAVVIMLPMNDTAWPAHSRRKSTDARSGVVSTRSPISA